MSDTALHSDTAPCCVGKALKAGPMQNQEGATGVSETNMKAGDMDEADGMHETEGMNEADDMNKPGDMDESGDMKEHGEMERSP